MIKYLYYIFLISVGILYKNQEKLILHAKKIDKSWKPIINYEYEEIFIESLNEKNKKDILNGFMYKTKTEKKGTVLYFHGNKGNMDSVQENILVYLHLGYDVLTMDYRGFGKSTGKIMTPEFFLKDSLLWFDYLSSRENQITIVGKSLGTGLATYVASKNQVNKLILITPYDSLHKVGKDKMPLLPVNFLMKYKIPSIDWIESIQCPIRIIHGTHDSTILPIRAENYYKKCEELKKDVKILWLIGAEHDNLHSYPEFFQEMENYLK